MISVNARWLSQRQTHLQYKTIGGLRCLTDKPGLYSSLKVLVKDKTFEKYKEQNLSSDTVAT